MERVASCSCGQLRLTCAGDPVRVSMCHCLECQKRTGSVFATQARFAHADVTIEGGSTQWTRTGDEGGTATFHFCPVCGATVYWEADGIPGFVAVAVGAFADPAFPPPHVSVYDGRRHPWAFAAGDLPLDPSRGSDDRGFTRAVSRRTIAAMDTDPADLPTAAALIGLELPAECVPGVGEALAALAMHWRILEPVADSAE